MRNFKSIKRSFGECPFWIMLPQITFEETVLTIGFTISFTGKPRTTKYVVKNVHVIDKLGHDITIQPKDPSNFISNTKKTVVISDKNLVKHEFTLVISFLTLGGEYIEATYVYEKNKPTILKSVAVGDMTKDEEDLFTMIFEDSNKKVKATGTTGKKITG